MDFIVEFLFEVIGEGIFYVSTNKKISKWIRYPLILIISLLYFGLIVLFCLLGVKMFEESIFISIIFLLISLFLSIICIKAFMKYYLSK